MTYRYSAVERDDALLREKIKELANKHKRYGSPRIQVLLRKEGFIVNHKKTERIYKEENLSLRTKKKKKLPLKERTNMLSATRSNEIWSMDFMSDSLSRGSRYRILTVIDNYSRFSPGTEVSFSIPSQRVISCLENMASLNGYPERIRLDNGPEFTSKVFTSWALTRGIHLDYIRPGKPTDNCYIESFNGKFRDECLNEKWFSTIKEARETIRSWLTDYNYKRPHSSLGNCSPYEFVMNRNNMINNQILALKVA
jgi:putative transposase